MVAVKMEQVQEVRLKQTWKDLRRIVSSVGVQTSGYAYVYSIIGGHLGSCLTRGPFF